MNELSLEEKEQIRLDVQRVKSKYKHHCTIYCVSKDFSLSKQKFLIHRDMSFCQLVYIIRKQLNLTPDAGVFFLIKSPTEGDILPKSSDFIGSLYDTHKNNELDCLYVYIMRESVFG